MYIIETGVKWADRTLDGVPAFDVGGQQLLLFDITDFFIPFFSKIT